MFLKKNKINFQAQNKQRTKQKICPLLCDYYYQVSHVQDNCR